MNNHRFKNWKTNKQELKKLKSDYNKWHPVTELKRSFLVWRGKKSKSEKESEIEKILTAHNLKFYREVSFDMRFRFDFYIPLIDLVIEYDGFYHFTNFKRMEKDKEKDNLLKRLGVKIIRYSKSHNLPLQIKHDLIYHPVLRK